jgi:hypothetical protein
MDWIRRSRDLMVLFLILILVSAVCIFEFSKIQKSNGRPAEWPSAIQKNDLEVKPQREKREGENKKNRRNEKRRE